MVEAVLGAVILPVVESAVVFLAGVLTGGLYSGRDSPRAARSLITLMTSTSQISLGHLASYEHVLVSLRSAIVGAVVMDALLRLGF